MDSTAVTVAMTTVSFLGAVLCYFIVAEGYGIRAALLVSVLVSGIGAAFPFPGVPTWARVAGVAASCVCGVLLGALHRSVKDASRRAPRPEDGDASQWTVYLLVERESGEIANMASACGSGMGSIADGLLSAYGRIEAHHREMGDVRSRWMLAIDRPHDEIDPDTVDLSIMLVCHVIQRDSGEWRRTPWTILDLDPSVEGTWGRIRSALGVSNP